MKKRLFIFCLIKFVFLLLLAETVHSEQSYLPPSIYRTLSTRHRSLFPQPAFRKIEISAHVAYKDSLEDNVSVSLYYGAFPGVYYPPLEMKPKKDAWHVDIPAKEVNAAAIYYYLKVDDGVKQSTAPDISPEENPFKIDIDYDYAENAPPKIVLMPRSKKLGDAPQCRNQNIIVSFYLFDQFAPFANAVELGYRIGENTKIFAAEIDRKSDYLYSARIPYDSFLNNIELRIAAFDSISSDSLKWPPMDSSMFSIKTNAKSCSNIPPYVRLTNHFKDAFLGLDSVMLGFREELKVEAVAVFAGSSAKGSVNLYYRSPFMSQYVQTKFARTNIDSIWTATIPSDAVVDPAISFYVEIVQDSNQVTAPVWTPLETLYTIKVLAPNSPPIIVLTAEAAALSDTPQQAGEAITIEARITDARGPGVSNAALHYRSSAAGHWHSTPLFSAGDSLYRARIPAEDVLIGTLEFYLWATDGEDTTTAPDRSMTPDSVYVIEIQNLNAPPVITLTPATEALSHVPQPARVEIQIEAFIVDTLGPDVQSAIVHYRHDDDPFSILTMNNIADSTWRAVLPASIVLPDTFYYYISATDGDSTGYNPEPPPDAWDQPHKIAVTMDNELPTIIHDPIFSASADSSIQIAAQVIDSTLAVERVELRYRNVKQGFISLPMSITDQHQYVAEIPGSAVIEPLVEYYIFAKGSFSPGDTAGTDIFYVKVLEPQAVLPNPFTPNNDGFNDYVTFHISGLQNGGGKVILYNRRGRVVRTLYGGEPWYGRNDSGGDLPPGVYLYAVTIDGELKDSGVLTLIR